MTSQQKYTLPLPNVKPRLTPPLSYGKTQPRPIARTLGKPVVRPA